MPKVSVVIPCYKAVRFLGETVESVRRQSLQDWELILVDDGSPDGTWDLIRELARSDVRIRPFTQANAGQSRARNFGLEVSSAEVRYVYFLDSDDLLHPDALRELSDYLDRNPSAGMVASEKTNIDETGAHLPPNPVRRWAPGFLGFPRTLSPGETVTPFASFYCGTAGGLWVMYRRTVLDEIGGWDEKLRAFEDCDIQARMALVAEAHHYPKVLNYYRQHPTQATSRHDFIGENYTRFREKWEVYQPKPGEVAKLRAAADFITSSKSPGGTSGSRPKPASSYSGLPHVRGSGGFRKTWARASARYLPVFASRSFDRPDRERTRNPGGRHLAVPGAAYFTAAQTRCTSSCSSRAWRNSPTSPRCSSVSSGNIFAT